MHTAIHIGNTKETVAAVKKAIIEILSLKEAGEESKSEAMRTLAVLSEVKNATIQNCNFNNGVLKKRKAKAK